MSIGGKTVIKPTFYNLPEEKRRRITAAIISEFSETSDEKVSINRIIHRAEISRGSFYQYFDDKVDLIEVLMKSFVEAVLENLDTAASGADNDIFSTYAQLFDIIASVSEDCENRTVLRRLSVGRKGIFCVTAFVLGLYCLLCGMNQPVLRASLLLLLLFSGVFLGGVIVYTDEMKKKLLGVDAECLEQFGAVSHETAVQMAEKCRARLGTDLALSVTGLAGPDGDGVHEVGTVFVSMAVEGETFVRQLSLGEKRTRSFIRRMAGNHAFDMMRRYMSGLKVE